MGSLATIPVIPVTHHKLTKAEYFHLLMHVRVGLTKYLWNTNIFLKSFDSMGLRKHEWSFPAKETKIPLSADERLMLHIALANWFYREGSGIEYWNVGRCIDGFFSECRWYLNEHQLPLVFTTAMSMLESLETIEKESALDANN